MSGSYLTEEKVLYIKHSWYMCKANFRGFFIVDPESVLVKHLFLYKA